jgi:tetratricopeptide (TPR) repeat protein
MSVRFGAVVALALGVAMGVSSLGCSRNAIEAVNLANEGDKARGTNIDDAISKYEQATQLDPSNHRILWKLATAYQKKEDWDKVASTCAKATKVADKHANYFWLRGYALTRLAEKGPTNWSEAKEPLEQAAALDPNYADPHFDLAEVLLHLDDEKGALEHYTKAIELKPDNLDYYGPLADLYIRLGFLNEAEQVLKEAMSYEKPGDKSAFNVHSLAGLVKEMRGDWDGAIKEYEAAKKSCGQCNEKGQQIAYFNLGAAYAKANPPRKSEANSNLLNFQKIVCKGGAAQRYADECMQAQELVKQVGGTAVP